MARPTIDNVWASTGVVGSAEDFDAKVSSGWAAEIPTHQIQNFWQKRVDELLQNIEQNGIMEWDPATPYRIGSWVLASDDEVYRSKTAGNSGNDPIGSPVNWETFTSIAKAVQATESIKGIALLATVGDTEAGVDDTKMITPKKLKDSILSVVPDATTGAKGKIQLSSNAEAQSGANTTKAITPATLKSVTALETRAGLVELSDSTESSNGTNSTTAMTPLRVKERIDANSTSFIRSNTSDQVTSGTITFNDNVKIGFGTSNGEGTLFSNGVGTFWDFGPDKDLTLRDVTSSRFLFDISTGDFHADGNMFAASTSVGSDRKLKKAIKVISNASEKLSTLTGVTYILKRSNKADAGLIAQDVQEVLPEAVTDFVPMKDESRRHLSLNYNAVMGLVVAAANEERDRVGELEETVKQLEETVKQLKETVQQLVDSNSEEREE